MSDPIASRATLADRLLVRARLVGGAALVGLLVGTLGVLALALLGSDARFASEQVFAVCALALGFGVLGWSGSVLAGRAVEGLQSSLDTNTEWTEADSRRAMARIGGFGAGGMAGTVISTVLLG
jgi:hypothetical protein